MAEEELTAECETVLARIEGNWEDVAAFAWRGYILAGSKLVMLQGDWQGEMVVP